MTDKDKIINLLKELNIKHKVTSDGIWLDNEVVEGATHNLFISFYHDDLDGKFQEICVYED